VCDYDVERVRELNDLSRSSMSGCRVVITRGVAALPAQQVREILQAVRVFDQFNSSNDPYGEHDFGAIMVQGNSIFWRFDYYDLDLVMRSPDPADPAVTLRVLTVMLAEEY